MGGRGGRRLIARFNFLIGNVFRRRRPSAGAGPTSRSPKRGGGERGCEDMQISRAAEKDEEEEGQGVGGGVGRHMMMGFIFSSVGPPSFSSSIFFPDPIGSGRHRILLEVSFHPVCVASEAPAGMRGTGDRRRYTYSAAAALRHQ